MQFCLRKLNYLIALYLMLDGIKKQSIAVQCLMYLKRSWFFESTTTLLPCPHTLLIYLLTYLLTYYCSQSYTGVIYSEFVFCVI